MILASFGFAFWNPCISAEAAIIVDHTCTKLSSIPTRAVTQAKQTLHIAYGHTSHGSQITDGMTGLTTYKGSLYAYNNGGTNGALDLANTPFSGASDLGNPNRTAWATATRNYLAAHPTTNVVIWSWCGQVSGATEADINTYLSLMSSLEMDYPNVKFVYMTGHLDGGGLTGNLHLRNEQIRNYCRINNKILYDFADIESYDPDGTYFGKKIPNDNCDYDSDGNGSRDKNWAIDWQNAHPGEWYNCGSAHSQPLNANQKAYAAWWLWARIAGWDGNATSVQTASQITQYGITWTFDSPHTVGQFVTGDWWVLGPVTITSVSPAPTTIDYSPGSWGRCQVNGSMVNPTPADGGEGGDKQAYHSGGYETFFNASAGVVFPKILSANSSLISTKAMATQASTNDLTGSPTTPRIESAAILTVVGEIPPTDAFRPAYAGTSKKIYRESDANFNSIPSISRPPGYQSYPSISTVTRWVERPWIDHMTNWAGRGMHPLLNMPPYGREIAGAIGDTALVMLLDVCPREDKKNIARHLIQIGIDTEGVVKADPLIWRVIAGQNAGRKFPLVFAAAMLNKPEMIPANAIFAEDSPYFGEDHNPPVQLWTGWQNSGHRYASNVLYLETYGFDNKGNPWDHEFYTPAQWWKAPFPTNGNLWPGYCMSCPPGDEGNTVHEGYRRITSQGYVGQTIAARILGLTDLWNHPAYFAYMDRWMYEDEGATGGVDNQIEAAGWDRITHSPSAGAAWGIMGSLNFAQKMFLQYRPLYETNSCSDGIKNGLETGVDCGGSCLKVCPSQTSSLGTQFNIFRNVFNPLKEDKLFIKFHLTEPARARLTVYDPKGSQIYLVLDEDRAAGDQETSWNGRNTSGAIVASGVYVLELKAGDTVEKKKVVVIK